MLEWKLRGVNVEQGILFTTLEPCLNRNAPKRGCSKHIVSARIKQVYVGIEDDNPAVKGRGIQHMVQYGNVSYEMYDRDLQDEILAANQEFFEWARQQDEKPAQEPIKLSAYEDSLPAVDREDLSSDAIELYRSAAGFDDYSQAELDRVFVKQRILVEEDGAVVPSGFGLLLFGKDPSLAMSHARLLPRAELGNGETSRQEFKSALVLVPGELEKWLKQVLPSTIDRSEMQRSERVDLPFEMIREAVVNALVHRDYDIEGQQCQLLIDQHTITITSPGGPIPPITLEQMQAFSAPIKSRNPLLHYVFARMGFAEQQGFGLSSLKARAEALGLPLPRIALEDSTIVLTIYRTGEAAAKTLKPDVLAELNSAETDGYQWLAKQAEPVSRREYQQAVGIGPRAGGLHLAKFIELGIVEKMGSGRTTKYRAFK